MGANSYSAEQIEALKIFDREPRRSFQVENGPAIYLSDLCDLAIRGLRNRPSSELLDLRARIDAIGIEVLGGKYLYRVDEIKRFDATKDGKP